jgi:hypothetical protein
MRNVTCIVLMVVFLLFLSGCIAYSTLQSAETLEPSKAVIGGGTAMLFTDGDFSIMPEVHVRYGLIKNVEIGTKFILPGILFADVKYRILQEPLTVSFDLGGSLFAFGSKSDETRGTIVGVYPMLITGKKHWYAGIKGLYISSKGQIEFLRVYKFDQSGWSSLNIVAGGIIGKKVQILPEINMYYTGRNHWFTVPAIGFLYHF